MRRDCVWAGAAVVCARCVAEGGMRCTHNRAPRANSRPWRQLLTVPHTLALPCFASQPGRRNVRRPTKAKKPKADPLYPARPRNFTIGNAVQVSPRLPPRAPCLLLPRHRRPVHRAVLRCLHLCEWGGVCERSVAGFAWCAGRCMRHVPCERLTPHAPFPLPPRLPSPAQARCRPLRPLAALREGAAPAQDPLDPLEGAPVPEPVQGRPGPQPGR